MAGHRVAADLDEEGLLGFLDQITNVLGLMLLLLVILLPFVNDPTDPGAPPPGNLVVEITWPDDVDVDVDLWLNAPGEERPVGYSHRKGVLWNLLRDDLGHVRDVGEANIEHAYSRGLVDGLYTVNVHLYALRGGAAPPIEVKASLGISNGKEIRDLLQRTITLTHKGHEVTVWSWWVEGGSFLPKSVEHIPRPLREHRFR